MGDRFFYKFWGQAIRFVARRDQQGGTKSWIEVRPVRARPGEEAQVELMAMDAAGLPRPERTLAIQLTRQGRARDHRARRRPGDQGPLHGQAHRQEPGEYRLTYDPGGGGSPAEARIRVTAATEELRHPNVNRPALESLAAATVASSSS